MSGFRFDAILSLVPIVVPGIVLIVAGIVVLIVAGIYYIGVYSSSGSGRQYPVVGIQVHGYIGRKVQRSATKQ